MSNSPTGLFVSRDGLPNFCAEHVMKPETLNNEERLEAKPEAAFCIECERRREQER